MPICMMIVNGAGARCGRLAGVEKVKVRGPGFRVPETRWACARCRGEEIAVVAPEIPDGARDSRIGPRCGACLSHRAGPSGVCPSCRSAMNFHARENPSRPPRHGSKARRAIQVAKPEVVAGYKYGDVILRIQAELNGGA